MNILKNLNKINYIKEHRKCIKELEYNLLGKNSLRIILHDFDKIVLLKIGFSKRIVKIIHQFWSRHHRQSIWFKIGLADYEQMVLDWESARYSKADKPYTAREYITKFVPKLKEKLFPICDKWGI